MIDAALVDQCTTDVHPQTMQTLIDAESSGNPYAIAGVGIEIVSQPTSREEAIESAHSLMDQGYNVSMGVAQINMHNFEGLGLTVESAFDPCQSIAAGEKILSDCYDRALNEYGQTDNQQALQAAFSCYYSNNFQRGFTPDDSNGNSYVQRIAERSEKYRVPSIEFNNADIETRGEGSSEQKNSGQQSRSPESGGNENQTEITAVEDTEPEKEDGWDVFSEF